MHQPYCTMMHADHFEIQLLQFVGRRVALDTPAPAYRTAKLWQVGDVSIATDPVVHYSERWLCHCAGRPGGRGATADRRGDQPKLPLHMFNAVVQDPAFAKISNKSLLLNNRAIHEIWHDVQRGTCYKMRCRRWHTPTRTRGQATPAEPARKTPRRAMSCDHATPCGVIQDRLFHGIEASGQRTG